MRDTFTAPLTQSALLTLVFGVGCSLQVSERVACVGDEDCIEAFGAGSSCRMDTGFCEPPSETHAEDLRLGFIYSSSQNDRGWSQTHHDAATEMAEIFNAEMFFRPSVQSADVAGQINDLIAVDDANVIFTISSGFITETLNSANQHPDRFFVSCCGDVSGPNLTSYFGRMYQPIYVLGYVAGKMTCTNRLGVVAALPLPQFVRHINAFTLGAREANPDVEVDVRWVGAFFDPEVEGAKAEELITNGSDVILAQSNSTAPLEARKGETIECTADGDTTDVPIYRIGYHSPTACESNPEQSLVRVLELDRLVRAQDPVHRRWQLRSGGHGLEPDDELRGLRGQLRRVRGRRADRRCDGGRGPAGRGHRRPAAPVSRAAQ